MRSVFSALSITVASTAAVIGTNAPAIAELKWVNSPGRYVKLYGQVSPSFQTVDDGVQTTDTLVDNTHSNSRVGMWLMQRTGQGEFSFNFETALGWRQSGAVSQVSNPQSWAWDKENIRKVDFIIANEAWGKIYVGQGSMATDGVADVSLNNNTMTTYNGLGDFAGTFQFRTSAGALSGITIGSVTLNLDGGRRGRIRYDTPSFGGFTIAIAAGSEILVSGNDDDFYDIALKYAEDYDGFHVKGGIGFSRRDSGGVDRDDTFGSVAIRFDNGFNFAVAAGSRDGGGDYVYALAGYEADVWSIGTTSIAIDYYDGSDFGLAGRGSEGYGLGINQNIDSLNTQVYFGYRRFALSDPDASYQDVDAFLLGARWRF